MRVHKLWSLRLGAWSLRLAAWGLTLAACIFLSLVLEAYGVYGVQVLRLVAILHTPLVVKFFYKFGFSVSGM